MNATVQTAHLLAAIKILVKLTKRHQTKYAAPCLKRIHISVGSSESLVLSATDLTTFIELPIQARVEDPDAGGALSIDGATLLSIVKSLPKNGETIIDGTFGMPCHIGPAALESSDPDDHPVRPLKPNATTALVSESDNLAAALNAVQPAASTDASRAQLTGISLTKAGIAGCNGKHLALIQGYDIGADAILPMSAVHAIIAMAKLEAGSCTIDVADQMAYIDLPAGRIVTRCIEGSFPDYLSLLPTEEGTSATVEAKVLSTAIKMAVAPLPKDKHRVKLYVGNGDVAICSNGMRRQAVPTTGAAHRAEYTEVSGYYWAPSLLAVLKPLKRVSMAIHADTHRGMLELQSTIGSGLRFRWVAMPIIVETTQ